MAKKAQRAAGRESHLLWKDDDVLERLNMIYERKGLVREYGKALKQVKEWAKARKQATFSVGPFEIEKKEVKMELEERQAESRKIIRVSIRKTKMA